VVSNNPAAMVNLDKTTMQADVTVIDVSFGFDGGGTSAPAPAHGRRWRRPGRADGRAEPGRGVPMHGALEGLTFGASIGAPFGLKTEIRP
jgi:long-chain fatty acid transport protein